jgi:hypothetical protein
MIDHTDERNWVAGESLEDVKCHDRGGANFGEVAPARCQADVTFPAEWSRITNR